MADPTKGELKELQLEVATLAVDPAIAQRIRQPGLLVAERHLRRQRHHRQRDDLRHAVKEGNAARQGQKEKARAEGTFVQMVENFPQRVPVFRRAGRHGLNDLEQGFFGFRAGDTHACSIRPVICRPG